MLKLNDVETLDDAYAKTGVEENLVLAIGLVESDGNPDALRYERGYRYMWDNEADAPFRSVTWNEATKATKAPKDFPGAPSDFYCSDDTEWFAQKMSWGPFQIMGAVAREHGFTGPFPVLCDVSSDISDILVILILNRLFERFGDKYGVEGVIAAYNAGSPRRNPDGSFQNQPYVDKVMSNYMELSQSQKEEAEVEVSDETPTWVKDLDEETEAAEAALEEPIEPPPLSLREVPELADLEEEVENQEEDSGISTEDPPAAEEELDFNDQDQKEKQSSLLDEQDYL